MIILPCFDIFLNSFSYLTCIFLLLFVFGLLFRLVGGK